MLSIIRVSMEHPPPDVKGKNVVILDFSFDKATTKKMIKKAKNLLSLITISRRWLSFMIFQTHILI